MNFNTVTIVASGVAQALGTENINDGLIIKALSTNASGVYIGNSLVTISTGFNLQPGDLLVLDPVGDLGSIYVVGIPNDKVCYITTSV